MKFRLTALALVAMAPAAFALTPAQVDSARSAGTLKEIVIFGGSAQSPLVAAYAYEICKPGTTDTFWDSASGAGYRAYSCNTNAAIAGSYPANTPILITKRDAGGSIYGVNPVALHNTQNAMVVNAATCTATGFAGSATVASYTCPTVALTTPIAGISDVEPSLFGIKTTVKTTSTFLNLPLGTDDNGTPWAPLTTAQVATMDVATSNETLFGIGVNLDLRNALQAAQGLAVGSDADADVPSIPRAFYASAVSGFVRAGTAGYAGWDSLTGVAADNAKTVNICRRTAGSGTQASSNLFFLNAPTIATTALGMLAPLSTAAGYPIAVPAGVTVNEGAGTGNVETCLTGFSGSGNYAMGVVTGEKDPIVVTPKTYRFVKIDGQFKSQANARTGNYDYVYSATMQFIAKGKPFAPAATDAAFLTDMRKNLGTPAKIAGLAAADAKQGVLAPPSNWTLTGAGSTCATAAGADALYGSCVERLDFASKFNDGVKLFGLAATAAYKTTSNQSLHIVR